MFSPSTPSTPISKATKSPISITKRIIYQGESYDCSLQSLIANESGTPGTPSGGARIRWQLKLFSVRLNEMYTCTVNTSEYLNMTRHCRNIVKQPTKLFQLVKDALFSQQRDLGVHESVGNLSWDMYFSANASMDSTTDLDAILQERMSSAASFNDEMLIPHDDLLRSGTENYHRAKMLLRIEYADQYIVEGFHFWVVLNRHTPQSSKLDTQKKLRKENKQLMHSISMLQIENKTQNHVIQSIQTDMSILQQDLHNQSIQSQILQSDFRQLRKENKALTQIVEQLSTRIKVLEEQNSKVLKENVTIKQYIQNIIALQGASKKATSANAGVSSPEGSTISSRHLKSPMTPATPIMTSHSAGFPDSPTIAPPDDYSALGADTDVPPIQLDGFWDPDKTYIGVGLSNQNRTAVNTKKYWTSCLANGVLMSGCYRISIRLDNVGYRNSICIGISDPNITLINTRCGDTERSWGLNCYDGYILHNGQKKAYLHVRDDTTSVGIRDGTVIHMLIDMDAQTLSYQVGEMDFGVAFRNVVGPVAPMCSLGDYGVSATILQIKEGS